MSLGLASRLAVTALAALLAAGCGVRGSLEAPADARAQGTATSAEAAAAGANTSATKKPHRDFILDGLVR